MPGKQRLNAVRTLLLNPREPYPDPHREVARGWYICRKSGDAAVCATGQATGLFVRGRCTRESLLAARASFEGKALSRSCVASVLPLAGAENIAEDGGLFRRAKRESIAKNRLGQLQVVISGFHRITLHRPRFDPASRQ